MNIVHSWSFQLSLGYNSIILPQPVTVYRGNFITLTQNTGLVAVDTSNTASYSDLVWNTTTQWTKLAEFSKWRFYLLPLTNFSSYQTSFNILHAYNIYIYPDLVFFAFSTIMWVCLYSFYMSHCIYPGINTGNT